MSSKFIRVTVYVSISSLLSANWYTIVHIYHILFIHSSVSGHLGCCFCLVTESCPILVTQIVAHQAPLPMGFPQARILEWVAIPFSRGHLGYFYHLAIGNNAAMNTGEQIIMESLFSILLSIYPEVKLLVYVVILFLLFEELPYHFFIAATPFYTPNNSAQGFQLLHIVTNTCDFGFFDGNHPNECEVVPY